MGALTSHHEGTKAFAHSWLRGGRVASVSVQRDLLSAPIARRIRKPVDPLPLLLTAPHILIRPMSKVPASVTQPSALPRRSPTASSRSTDEAALAGADDGHARAPRRLRRHHEQEWARWAIWECGRAVGTYSASIHDLYMARGRGDVPPVTVPAINVRGASYDTARSHLPHRQALDGGAFILEIARSEIAYTEQRPAEYVAVMLAAALREGIAGRCSSRAITSR
jgi:hypothetical protein